MAIFLGAAFFSACRTLYYIVLGLEPNIAPQMFIVFSPILALPIAVAAAIVHGIIGILTYDRGLKWFFAGISYSSILLGLITPWLLLVFVFLNPISILVYSRLGNKEKGPE